MKRCFLLFLVVLLAANPAFACTDFQIKTTDSSVIIGRSMEFAIDIDSSIIVQPRGRKIQGQSPDGGNGLEWTSKYGFIAVNAFGMEDAIVDGFNEKGLSFGLLWLAGITEYQDAPEPEYKRAVSILNLGAWMLGNFATVDEIREAIGDIRVWGEFIPELGIIPPLHVALHDAEGNNLVIEFIDKEVRIHNNPLGVLTNAPELDWHFTNLRNYINVTSWNAKPLKLGNITLDGLGNGSGFAGIPGDWTPPSRFVRMAFFINFADPADTAAGGVNLAEHILNTVDIPLGNIKEDQSGHVLEGHTEWVVIKDLTNKVLYFRTYENLTLRSVDLKTLNLKPGAMLKSVPLSTGNCSIDDITEKLM